MKTITMTLDEYNQDIRNARQEGVCKKQDLIDILKTAMRTIDYGLTEQEIYVLRKDIYKFMDSLEREST